jgi:hypothetical protein
LFLESEAQGMKLRKFYNSGGALLLAIMLAAFNPLAAAASVKQNRAGRLVRQAESATGDRFTFATETPGGVEVFAVAKPKAEMLRAIDDGFRQLFAIARRNGYREHLRLADYTVFIARPDRTHDRNKAYSPALKIAAQGYTGSVYDKGGYIFVAGMVLTLDPSSFIVPEHTGEWARVSEVVRYEVEHLVLYHNDRARYNATMNHSRGGAHPILR